METLGLKEGNIRATRESAEAIAQRIKPCYKVRELGEQVCMSQILNITERIMWQLTRRLSVLTGLSSD